MPESDNLIAGCLGYLIISECQFFWTIGVKIPVWSNKQRKADGLAGLSVYFLQLKLWTPIVDEVPSLSFSESTFWKKCQMILVEEVCEDRPWVTVKLFSLLVHGCASPCWQETLMLLSDRWGRKFLVTPVSPVRAVVCLFSFLSFFLTISLRWHEKGLWGLGRGDNYQIWWKRDLFYLSN